MPLGEIVTRVYAQPGLGTEPGPQVSVQAAACEPRVDVRVQECSPIIVALCLGIAALICCASVLLENVTCLSCATLRAPGYLSASALWI